MTAGHDVHGLRHHDPLCPPGIKPDHEKCLTCTLLRQARAEERGKFMAVANMLRSLVEMPTYCDTPEDLQLDKSATTVL